MSLLQACATVYLMFGIGFAVWFLHDIYRAEKRVLAGTASPSDKRVVSFNLVFMVPLIIVLWWVALLIFIFSGDDDKDPQNKVPPQYR